MKGKRVYSVWSIIALLAFFVTIATPIAYGIAEAGTVWQCRYCGQRTECGGSSTPAYAHCLRGPNKGNPHVYERIR